VICRCAMNKQNKQLTGAQAPNINQTN